MFRARQENGVDDARVTRVVVQPENKLCHTCVRAENSAARLRLLPAPARLKRARVPAPAGSYRPGCTIGRVSRWYPRFILAPGGAGR
jgi:hypothetical protein